MDRWHPQAIRKRVTNDQNTVLDPTGRATICCNIPGGNCKDFREYLEIIYWKHMTPSRQKDPSPCPAPAKQVSGIILETSAVTWKPLLL